MLWTLLFSRETNSETYSVDGQEPPQEASTETEPVSTETDPPPGRRPILNLNSGSDESFNRALEEHDRSQAEALDREQEQRDREQARLELQYRADHNLISTQGEFDCLKYVCFNIAI